MGCTDHNVIAGPVVSGTESLEATAHLKQYFAENRNDTIEMFVGHKVEMTRYKWLAKTWYSWPDSSLNVLD